MFKSLFMRLLGRDIRSITKRVTRMKSDIADNIARNDTQIALLSEAVTALKDAQDALQAENTTGANIAKSLQVM